ncbi:dTDP-4-dehydrorhamnose reductase [Mesorhizobium sp. L-8-3]|uniref:dTDP-4-dehydrorhamnose reductase n=1 Tax=Mesorhizobium sp. L-8-3 TaxID=2744522 RepID=UPI0019387D55|nr:dTDP-4-dehydrorhamnose reductase [Mesorhizobium sp. L-8-3]BCH23921.1 NAD(P)-dependent oxidoreductase [Mesorhizobium sp. L-8-3]
MTARAKVLVTGKAGQMALALACLEAPDLEIVTLGRPELDIADRASVARAFAAVRPVIVVNTAAYTEVDKAETDVATAFAVNRDGAANVATAAAEQGCPVIHFSTDYVFPGDKPDPYRETDETGPVSVYGRSKLAGEQAVADANPAHVILRTAWVYSPDGRNFLKTMLRLARERDEIGVVGDQHGTPTSAAFLARAVAAVVRHVLADPAGASWRGVFHLVADGATDWAGFAEEIFAQSAKRGGPSARVRRITTADYKTAAARPANSRLDTTRLSAVFGIKPPRWQDDVAACVDALLRQNPSSDRALAGAATFSHKGRREHLSSVSANRER